MEIEFKPLPTISDYLDQIDEIEISTENLDDLAAKIRASTGLTLESCHILIKMFFQEIQKEMIKGEVVSLKEFGKFMIACPRNQMGKYVKVKFKPCQELVWAIKYK